MRHRHLALALLVAPLAAAAQRPPSGPSPQDCRAFASNGRLTEGQAFAAAIGSDLSVRLTPEGPHGWAISVSPSGDASTDYVWPVSPPYRTAPHRKIGPGYGLSAEDSVALERDLRFVLDAATYEEASAVAARMDAPEVEAMLARVATGTLAVTVTSFGVRPFTLPDGCSERALSWIVFSGRACFPRAPVKE